jgi:aspartate carbamoyltransferase catalytic subunit
MPLRKIHVGILGDLRYGRTTHSLIQALSLYDMKLSAIAPRSLELPQGTLDELRERGVDVTTYEDVSEVIRDLDVLYVTRIQRERFPDTATYMNVAHSYRITPETLGGVRDNLIILHPLPRAGEIDPRVDALPYAKYFDQARNGVPVRMALLLEVMG